MSKVIFMTNVIRRFGIMQQMLDKLQARGELQGDYSCWWITEDTVWNAEAEKHKARERIHRAMADARLLAIPASRSRVADSDPD